jgi:hypothetical protein
VLNTTFKNISVNTFVAEIGVPREIHKPVASHWQTLSHNVLSSTERGVKHLTSNGQMMNQTFVYVVHNIKPRWVIMWELSVVLLILMEFMIITVYKISFHINQWKALVCWKYVFCWGSLDGICISCEVPSIADISEQS